MSAKEPASFEALAPAVANDVQAAPQTSLVVRKRDGATVQSFNAHKIAKAIAGAWTDCKGKVEKSDEVVIDRVTQKVLSVLPHTQPIDVERIQDAVEVALMQLGYFDVAKAFILYRDEHAKARAQRKAIDVAAIADYTTLAKYARYRPELRRRETFDEIVDRVQAMHTRRFPQLREEIAWAFGLVRRKWVLPSMRTMQYGGAAIEDVSVRAFNCCATPVDRPRVFGEVLYLLLAGCGVGFSVQHEHVSKLPPLGRVNDDEVVHHTVGDTIEGWADALNELVQAHIHGYYVEFDYSDIRPRGAPLKTSGGKAPGHLGLKAALEAIRQVLVGAAGRKLRPIECYDILCHAADAVLSGGNRRSASICLFSIDDAEMLSAKTGDWYVKYPWRQNSNNSAVCLRGEVTEKQFKRIFDLAREWGEPGFVFSNDVDYLYNPCQPAWATVLTPDGIRTFADIDVGSTIWTGKRWTKVVRKLATGVKPVYAYRTRAGTFYGTENHRVLCRGQKVEVGKAPMIDAADGISHEIVTRQALGDMPVFDITVEDSDHVYWTDGLIVSNCGEAALHGTLTITQDNLIEARARLGRKVEIGEKFSGFGFCNLTTINAAACRTRDAFREAAKAATFIGTLQASYTSAPYLGPVTEMIMERDALLGVSMTGMLDNVDLACDASFQREVAEAIVEWNREFAARIGIRSAARTTCIKPEGTGSLVLRAVASGHHPHHARRYFRRIVAKDNEPVFKFFQSKNPHMCVRRDAKTFVIEFLVEAPEGALLKEDLGAIEFLAMARSTQQNWVLPGTARTSDSPGLNHNVSLTVHVRDGEWPAVADYLWSNRHDFTAVSVLPFTADKLYPLAPYEAITTPADEARWNEIAAKYISVDYTEMIEDGDTTALAGEQACAGGKCEL